MYASCEHDTRDRMVNPAKHLHRSRCKSDLVAGHIAVLIPEKRHVPFLDLVGVRDRGRPVRRAKRLEPYVGLVRCEQRFGCASGRDILHEPSPCFSDLVPVAGADDRPAVKRFRLIRSDKIVVLTGSQRSPATRDLGSSYASLTASTL